MNDAMVNPMVQEHASVDISSMDQNHAKTTPMKYAMDPHGTL